MAEMVVPCDDPSPVRFWQNYFDAGEHSMGKSANALSDADRRPFGQS
ncbi:hypothetical protein [Brevibacterium sp. ZH18]|nr:hypothetical protein [Brevibacterium sp. ZH18]